MNTAINGYSLEDCCYLTDDGNWTDCIWKNKKTLDNLSGDGYVIRLHLENAVIYGIRILSDDDVEIDNSTKNNVL